MNEHENASTQTAAFTISNKNQMSVTFNATADAATALSIGDEVTVQKSGNDYTAIITSIDSKADEGTGLFPVEAQIQDDGGALLSGVTVKVSAATQKGGERPARPDRQRLLRGWAGIRLYIRGRRGPPHRL